MCCGMTKRRTSPGESLARHVLAMGNRDGAIEQYNILQNIDQDWAEKLQGLITP